MPQPQISWVMHSPVEWDLYTAVARASQMSDSTPMSDICRHQQGGCGIPILLPSRPTFDPARAKAT